MTGARHLSPFLGGRMISAQLLRKSVFIRELLPQDLKLEIEHLPQNEAIDVAEFLAHVVGRARARQLSASDRAQWLVELKRNRSKTLDAPSWLWNSVVDLVAAHKAAYLRQGSRTSNSVDVRFPLARLEADRLYPVVCETRPRSCFGRIWRMLGRPGRPPNRECRSRHDFHDLLMIALCAVLSGGQNAMDMAVFAKAKEPLLRSVMRVGPASTLNQSQLWAPVHGDVVLAARVSQSAPVRMLIWLILETVCCRQLAISVSKMSAPSR